jgi:predicted naringenin-chalcone synthase
VGGGYEITDAVMRGLQTHAEQFEADDRCLGSVGNASCNRTLHVKATATYSEKK